MWRWSARPAAGPRGRRGGRVDNLPRTRLEHLASTSIELSVACAIQLAHVACANGGDNLIRAKTCARIQGHERPRSLCALPALYAHSRMCHDSSVVARTDLRADLSRRTVAECERGGCPRSVTVQPRGARNVAADGAVRLGDDPPQPADQGRQTDFESRSTRIAVASTKSGPSIATAVVCGRSPARRNCPLLTPFGRRMGNSSRTWRGAPQCTLSI
jgi:hypothetical protein